MNNLKRLFIKPEQFKILTEIFDNYCPKAEIWAYGSRIKGEAHLGSDLDLVVRDFNSNKKFLYKLKELIQDSNIPFLVDIHEFNKLSESFQCEILKDYIIIYKGSEKAS